MSEQTAETAATTETETAASTEALTLPDDHPLVKTLAEQKKAIRDLKARAAKLDEIEEAQKSEAQKAADALAKAEQRAAQAETKALSLQIATEHQLGAEDAALLAALPDEDSMRALAKRLAGQADEQKKNGNRVPKEGTSTTSSPSADDEVREFARGLFRREG